MDEERLDFTSKGVKIIAERMRRGDITEEELHEAARNTEKILREEGGIDLTVSYLGTLPHAREKKKVVQVSLTLYVEE